MYRAVLFTLSVLLLLIIDVLGIGLAVTGGSTALACVFAVVAALLIWAMFAVRFDSRRRRRRWPHRGATRDDYNPWIGGGLGGR